MGMTRESKLKNKVTELKVSELSFKLMFNEKELYLFKYILQNNDGNGA